MKADSVCSTVKSQLRAHKTLSVEGGNATSSKADRGRFELMAVMSLRQPGHTRKFSLVWSHQSIDQPFIPPPGSRGAAGCRRKINETAPSHTHTREFESIHTCSTAGEAI